MNKNNETCVQRVKVVFFQPSDPMSGKPVKSHANRSSGKFSGHLSGWLAGGLKRFPVLNRLNREPAGSMEDVTIRDAALLLPRKVEKINKMIRTLQDTHEDWSIYKAGNQIVLETTTLDFSNIAALLERNGFLHSEYDLRVEYERKWGML